MLTTVERTTVDTAWWSSPDWQRYEALASVTLSREQELREAHWSTRVIDLTRTEGQRWHDLRKSYRQLIAIATRTLCIEPVLPAVVPEFMKMHALVAGRQTRPTETWELMADWVRTGSLRVMGARDAYGWCGFVGTYRWNRWSYYGHSVTTRPNINAALVWRAMNDVVELGATHYEVGWQGHATDDKGAAIEFFRRGFGGTDWPFAASETR